MLTQLKCLMVVACLLTSAAAASAAETYDVDGVHSSVSFMIAHQDISMIHGRFNEFSGKFTIDKDDPSKSKFAFEVKVDSVDTNNQKRDEHLRAPDYFNTKQYPTMNFESTKVKKVDGGYDVTGDLTLHGVKKSISLTLKGGEKVVEFPKGTPRIGVTCNTVIKRSEFDMKTALGGLGDDVHIILGLEAAKPKQP